jgi:ABC-2 type transport system ATP-binding protein
MWRTISVIQLTNLSKHYGDCKAVTNISLQIPQGSIFGFLGMNGAGKTSTIKMMVGILRPTTGSITIANHCLAREPQKAKAAIGYVPDRPYVYPKLSGREYLYFMCDLYNVAISDVEERINTVLDEYGMTEHQNNLIESYSHGMKQRIAFCGALVHRPEVLIVDEPMVGLDPHGAKTLKSALKRQSAAGTTVFLSTHSLHVAEELADTIAILHRGEIIISGSFQEIQRMSQQGHEHLEEIFIELTSQAAPYAIHAGGM